MDKRLRVIMDCDKPYGGVNIIWMGDLLQLPPVSKRGENVGFIFEDSMAAGVAPQKLASKHPHA